MKHSILKESKITQSACFLLAGSLALVLSSLVASAQTGTGTVTGTVRDQLAVVPLAEVTITNLDTDISRKESTSGEGFYYFGALPPGSYNMVVEKPGFKKSVGTLVLQVGQTITFDVPLEVGDFVITIDVTAPRIPAETAVAGVKDFQRIRQLPLNGREISSLFDLTAGVEGEGNARVNGLKVGSLEVTLDGVSTIDRFGGGISRVQPGLDTVQEFRVETVGSDARFSRPATVTLATRSGTNEFHGTLFETHRNNAGGLVARRREDTDGNLPELIRNEFGVSAGGPIFFPKPLFGPLAYDGHKKLFWFAAYEGLRQRQRRLADDDTTPTEAMWNGDLSNMIDENGNKWVIYDPLTTDSQGRRQAFAGNIIPANRISPFAKLLKTLTAPPTNNNNPHLAPNFEKFYPDNLDANKLTTRVDAVGTNRNNLSVRWSRGTRRGIVEGGVAGEPVNKDAGVGTARNETVAHNLSISHTLTLS